MTRKEYPTDIVTDDGWERIHEGHDLDPALIRDDLVHAHGDEPGAEPVITECYLHYMPRVKWCGRHDWACDNEGEWHAHWLAVKPHPEAAFTLVRWPAKHAPSVIGSDR